MNIKLRDLIKIINTDCSTYSVFALENSAEDVSKIIDDESISDYYDWDVCELVTYIDFMKVDEYTMAGDINERNIGIGITIREPKGELNN